MMLRLWQRALKFLQPFKCAFTNASLVQVRTVQLGWKSRLPPELPIEIWLEIFQFATYVHHDITVAPLDPFTTKHTVTNAMGANTPALAMRTKLALVQVSHAWRHIAIQTLYRTLFVRSPARATIILRNLERSRLPTTSLLGQLTSLGYGQFVRHVVVSTFTRGSKGIQYLQLVFRILRQCPNLRILSGLWVHTLPAEFLKALSELLSPKLSELYWGEHHLQPHTHTGVDFLANFQHLRVLDIRDFMGSLPSPSVQSISKPTLPFLHTLILSSNPTSLNAAIHLSLPSLRSLTMKQSIWNDDSKELLRAFLRNHGRSLIMIDLPTCYTDFEPQSMSDTLSMNNSIGIYLYIFLAPDICPNLETIVLPVSSPLFQAYTHPNIRRIGIYGVNVEGLYPDKCSPTKDLLMAINIHKYPRLESIQTVDFLVDAHADSTLIKDIFIWWVERFEAMGVLLLDGEGVLWTYHEAASFEPEDNCLKLQSHRVTCSNTELGVVSKPYKNMKYDTADC